MATLGDFLEQNQGLFSKRKPTSDTRKCESSL